MRLEEIRALQDAGAYAESESVLRDLLAENPDHPEASYRLGLALLRTGRPSEAAWPLKKASETEEFATQAGVLLSQTFLQMRNLEEAIGAASAVLGIAPNDDRALATRLQAALFLNRHEEALEDAERLLLMDPSSIEGLYGKAGALVGLERMEDAEKAFEDFEKSTEREEAAAASRACLLLASFYGRVQEDTERSVTKAEECLEKYPFDASLRNLAVQLYDDLEQDERALALLRAWLEENPQDFEGRVFLAQRLTGAGEEEEAVALLEEAAQNMGTTGAWLALADLHRRIGNSEEARDALEQALAVGNPRDEGIRFTLADVLVNLGQLTEAEEIIADFDEAIYRDTILGRLALERGDYRGALNLFERVLGQWPNNWGVRMAAAQAAHALGDTERTMSELREASRAAPEETDAALLLARLYLARGDFASAVSFAQRHAAHREFTGPEAHLIGAWARTALGNYGEARELLRKLQATEEYQALAVAELAKVTLAESGVEAATAELARRKLDLSEAKNQVALRQLVDLYFRADQGEQARELLEGLVQRQPESASLRALLGSVELRLGRLEAAAKSFEKASELDSECPGALYGQGALALAEGRSADALELIDRAAALEPDNAEYRYLAAQAAAADPAEAERRLRELLGTHPEHAAASNDLAWLLAQRGESLELAEELAERARRIMAAPEFIDTLGYVQLRRGDLDAAIDTFNEALTARPDYGTARYHLGLALAKKGDREGALAALRAALDSGPFPESAAARTELARLQEAGGRAR